MPKSPKITGGKRKINVFPYKDQASKTTKVSQSVSLAKHETTKRVASATISKKVVTSSDQKKVKGKFINPPLNQAITTIKGFNAS